MKRKLKILFFAIMFDINLISSWSSNLTINNETYTILSQTAELPLLNTKAFLLKEKYDIHQKFVANKFNICTDVDDAIDVIKEIYENSKEDAIWAAENLLYIYVEYNESIDGYTKKLEDLDPIKFKKAIQKMYFVAYEKIRLN